VKQVFDSKKPKSRLITAALILCAGFVIIFTVIIIPALKKSIHKNLVSEIYGYYEFDENIYTFPFSSFLPVKENMPYYEFSEEYLTIISHVDGSEKKFPATTEVKPLNKDYFEKMFEPGFDIPDISGFKKCYRYAVYSDDAQSEYQLYKMDNEVWLVHVIKNRIWSIYKLVKNAQT
jgi:hypothetical protein